MFPNMKRLCWGVKAVRNSVSGLVKTWTIDTCKIPLSEHCSLSSVPFLCLLRS